MKSRCLNFVFCSVAMYESTGDTAQLTIFFRVVDKNFKITEELAALVPVKDTTEATDMYTQPCKVP